MVLAPGGLIAWLFVGLIAGWLTGKIVQGSGFGVIGDLVLGLVGAVIGGFILGFFIHGSAGFIGSIVVAVIGAVILVTLARTLTGHRSL
ncbi:MAG: GlsB/YeaQ/YmgE family stress response membrane protein [Chloroflexi bacterium]|nr:GlsB/YeaQ/YmgE family stress response membrane protein [Chloroflexota bacterium]